MAEIINQIALFFERLILTVGYPGIFVVMFAENVFTPIPTEPLLPLSGILAAQGRLHFALVWMAAVTGGTLGSLVLYAVGRKGGEPAVRGLIRRWGRYVGFGEGNLDRALGLFNRYGAIMVFVGRAIPMVRPTVSLVSGMSGLKLRVFIPFTLLSSGIANGLYLALGYVLGENWRDFLGLISRYEPVIVGAAAVGGALLGVFLLWRWMRGRKSIPSSTPSPMHGEEARIE
ncbi:MAG: DedA family protein [Anaerolineae bacterium]|nr:DedA family protein [Anaerolineae bacterium]